MNSVTTDSTSVVLTGLDGSNPLAFLASLGLLRSISEQCPASNFRLAWSKYPGSLATLGIFIHDGPFK